MAPQKDSSARDASFKVLLDLLLVVLVAIPILVLKFAVPPYERGFFCNDESIAHPHKSNSIPTPLLVVVACGLPTLVMIFVELGLYRWSRKRYDTQGRPVPQRYYAMFGKNIHIYLVTIYEVVGAFIFGAVVCQTATDILKYNLGRLRPNFLAICKPDYSLFSCVDDDGHSKYVTDFVCNETDHELLEEARLSHPSGHASLSFYCAVFLVLYLQIRLKWRGSKLLCPFLQALALYLALYCCTTRISDYWHHWSDVLSGAVLGTIIALLVTLRVSVLFKVPRVKDVTMERQDTVTTMETQLQNSPNSRTPTSQKDGYDFQDTTTLHDV